MILEIVTPHRNTKQLINLLSYILEEASSQLLNNFTTYWRSLVYYCTYRIRNLFLNNILRWVFHNEMKITFYRLRTIDLHHVTFK